MLKRSKRIHGKTAIETIVKEGRRVSGPFFASVAVPSEAGFNRFAIVVSKKIEKSSVKRNRKRRQFYELIRLWEQANEVSSSSGSDIVLLVRAPALNASFGELQAAVSSFLSHP